MTESFIDKIVEMSTQSIDVEYRQSLTKRTLEDGAMLAELKRQADYYEAMRKSFASVTGRPDATMAADVSKRLGQAYDEVARWLDQVQSFYALVSQQNLNPDAVVYTVTTPFTVRTMTGLSLSTIVV